MDLGQLAFLSGLQSGPSSGAPNPSNAPNFFDLPLQFLHTSPIQQNNLPSSVSPITDFFASFPLLWGSQANPAPVQQMKALDAQTGYYAPSWADLIMSQYSPEARRLLFIQGWKPWL